MPPKRGKKAAAKPKELKLKHECALKTRSKRCSGCEIGIVDGKRENIHSLQEKIEKSLELLESNYQNYNSL